MNFYYKYYAALQQDSSSKIHLISAFADALNRIYLVSNTVIIENNKYSRNLNVQSTKIFIDSMQKWN